MYDPFANQVPPPGMMATTAVPQTALAPNNALAAIQAKHMRNGPRMYPGGPDGQFPLNPRANQGSPFHQALMDWRGQRPDRPDLSVMQGHWGDFGQDGMLPTNLPPEVQQYITSMQDWRAERPNRRTWTPPGTAPTTVA